MIKLIKKNLRQPWHRFYIKLEGEGNTLYRHTKEYVKYFINDQKFVASIIEINTKHDMRRTYITRRIKHGKGKI